MRSFFFRDPVHVLCERKRINTVNQFEQRQRMPDLIFLEMTDEMPAQVRRQLWNLYSRFLHATFAEQGLPGFIRLPHLLGWMRLRNRNKFDVINRTPSFGRSSRNPFPNPRK